MGVAASMQLLDRQRHFLIRTGAAVRAVAAIALLGRSEHRPHALQAVLDRELSRRSLVDIAERQPLTGGDEVIGYHLLEQPRGSAERQVQAQRHLQEVDGRSVKLLYERESSGARDPDLTVQPERWVVFGGSVGVREGFDRDELAVVAQLDPCLRHARPRSHDVGAVRHVDVPTWAPGFLDRSAQIGHQRVAALDECERFLTRVSVVAILPHGAQVLLPGSGDRSPYADDAWLHRSIPSRRGRVNKRPRYPAPKSSRRVPRRDPFHGAKYDSLDESPSRVPQNSRSAA